MIRSDLEKVPRPFDLTTFRASRAARVHLRAAFFANARARGELGEPHFGFLFGLLRASGDKSPTVGSLP